MYKYLLLLLAIPAAATPLEMVSPSIESVGSTNTVMGITIASSPVTSVIISTAALYRQVCVQNLDQSGYLACGETINVSTMSSSAFAGVIITTASTTNIVPPYCFTVPPGTNFYCGSSRVNTTSRAIIMRKR